MIKTERLEIEIAFEDEILALIDEQTDEGLKAAYTEMLNGSRAHPQERAWYAPWFIRLHDGQRIGELGFKGLADGSVEIGYGLSPEHWNKGYATEAVRAAVTWAASQPGVGRIEAETEPDNIASQKVLAKAGFVPTGEWGEEGPRFVWSGSMP